MKLLSQKVLLACLGLGLAVTASGCMTSPGNGEHIGNVEGNISFSGYMLEPNKWVKIQAKHRTDGWQTIGWAKSKSWSVPYSGQDWHHWNTSVKIPWGYWTYIGVSNPNGQFSAEVRAINYSTNGMLSNFDAGYGDWFNYNESLGEMWEDHGHDGTVTIYGNVYVE